MLETPQKHRRWADLTPEEREQRRYLRSLRKNYNNTVSVNGFGVAIRGARWLLPWGLWSYPGYSKGLRDLFRNRVKACTISSWRRGDYAVGTWALIALAEEIERRVRLGEELARELRTLAASRKPKLRGLQIRDPETGLLKYRHRPGSGDPNTPYAKRKARLSEQRQAERKL